jgi:hypothetical protein
LAKPQRAPAPHRPADVIAHDNDANDRGDAGSIWRSALEFIFERETVSVTRIKVTAEEIAIGHDRQASVIWRRLQSGWLLAICGGDLSGEVIELPRSR